MDGDFHAKVMLCGADASKAEQKLHLPERQCSFTFTASALLCALGATVLYPLLGLDNFSLDPASIRALVLTYLRSMLGSLGIFAAVYALLAAVLLGLMFAAHHQTKRQYQPNN